MAKNDKVRVEGMTRLEWLKNNADIVRQEGGDDDEVFYNQIETRLGFSHFGPEGVNIANEDDERLAAAYINSLARYEAEADGDPTWAPRSVESLVAREGVTAREAGVIAIMAAREYPLESTQRDTLVRFYRWLHTNTDTFDSTMVEVTLEAGDPLGFDETERLEQINLFLSNK